MNPNTTHKVEKDIAITPAEYWRLRKEENKRMKHEWELHCMAETLRLKNKGVSL